MKFISHGSGLTITFIRYKYRRNISINIVVEETHVKNFFGNSYLMLQNEIFWKFLEIFGNLDRLTLSALHAEVTATIHSDSRK